MLLIMLAGISFSGGGTALFSNIGIPLFSSMGLGVACAAELPTFQLTFKPHGTFEPVRLEVPAGRFKIELSNESDDPVEFESIPLRKEKVLAPGAKSFVVITVSRPGEYPFFDDFHPGVQGTLVVKAKD